MVLKIKKKRDQESTKAKLLKAALDVFSKDGYDAATTRHIAKKAGVNESLIHRYFESKLGLFLALKQQYRENFIKEILGYDESKTLEEELLRFITSRLYMGKQEKKFFKLSISRSILDTKVRDEMRNYASMKPPELVKRFEHFRGKGQLRRDIDLQELIGICHSLALAFTILLDAMECIDLKDAERLAKTAAQLLTKGLVPRS